MFYSNQDAVVDELFFVHRILGLVARATAWNGIALNVSLFIIQSINTVIAIRTIVVLCARKVDITLSTPETWLGHHLKSF